MMRKDQSEWKDVCGGWGGMPFVFYYYYYSVEIRIKKISWRERPGFWGDQNDDEKDV